jgi:hypothetical protein
MYTVPDRIINSLPIPQSCPRPSHITESHWNEWVIDSAVDPELTSLNVISLSGYEPYDRLLYGLPNSERRNDGRLRDRWLRRYAHTEHGGWWCSGINVLTGDDGSWGQFKPDRPYHYENHKLLKYEAPPKVPTEITALKVNFWLTWNIVRRQNEEAKKAWIQRLWQTYYQQISPTEFHLQDTREMGDCSRRRLRASTRRSRKTNNFIRGTDAIQSISATSLGEFQAACEIREYQEIDRILLQGIRHYTPFHSIQFARTDSGGIEGLVRLVDVDFWRWVISTPTIPIIITEGGKKAGVTITAGYIAIALPGIFNGYRQPKDEFGRKTGLAKLIPQLEVFATPGRTIYFAFDQDTKANTIANVNKAIAKTGQLFTKAGVDVKVIQWQEEAKGVDDLIVQYGAEAFDRAYDNAVSLETWLAQSSVQLTYQPNIRVERRYLSPDLQIPETAKLICLKSPKGTGKTHLLEQIVSEATREGKWVLLLTHRIQLGEALCQRVGLPYLTEIKTVECGTVLGYGLCIDSLHPNSGARFNANSWEDGIIIIDEAEQVIWHMLNSATCASQRVEILAQFKTLIQNNLSGDGKVYLADADLSDVAIDYIRFLAGFYVEPFVIVNDWQPPQQHRWTIHSYEDHNPARLVRDLVHHIEAGGKPFISCSAQKLKSKWGTQNLESYLQLLFPDKKILRIDSETVSDPHHRAYGCIAHLNQILPQYDIAIASPSIETGVSIDIQGHFTSVWAIAQGVQTADSIRQVLARIRAIVPRYLWAARRGLHNCLVGNGATTTSALIAHTKNKASTNIRFLQAADAHINELDLNTNFQPESLNTWARRGCYINLTMQNYRGAIVSGLMREGHLIISPPETDNCSKDVEEQLKQVAATKYEAQCQFIADAPVPTESEYQKLKDKRAKTKEERASERKGNLVRRYGNDISITPELVKKDDEGWYARLLSHYYLTVGRPFLIERDLKQLKSIANSTKNRFWLPDFNRSLLSTSLRLLETLIVGLLKPGIEYRGSDPNLALLAELAHSNRRELKTFLGLTIVESDSPIKIVQKLLGLLGLKLTCIGRLGSREQRERVYILEPPDDGRDEIFSSWRQRDRASSSSVSTIGKDIIYSTWGNS